MGTFLRELWSLLTRPDVVIAVHALVAAVASGHAVMTKEEPRAAVGWVGLIWLSPLIGAALYYFLGINRIRRRAALVMSGGHELAPRLGPLPNPLRQGQELLSGGRSHAPLASLVHLGNQVARLPLLPGNRVTPLINGDEAFPAMLAAVAGAKRSVMLASYIFDYDDAGKEFLAALAAAVKRGVEVRVLIDATGARYSFPSVVQPLRQAGITVARFMPNLSPNRFSAFNLRSHRKIMVVDGTVGFTGGMNIRQANYVLKNYPHPIQDLHFRVEGPVVAHMRQAFVEDWIFTTKEQLQGDAWLPEIAAAGEVIARGVLDGPDSDFEKILWVMLGATFAAQRRVRIITPYFLPESTTARFLTVAAMSGIEVEIILPAKGNIRLVEWASLAILPALMRQNCRVYLSPPPFDHTKMMLIDDAWSFIGSANWDARSLRLNFEFNIECYDAALTGRLNAIFEAKRAKARPLTARELASRNFPSRLRNGIVRLMAPYL